MPAAFRRLLAAGAIDSTGDGVFAAAIPMLAATITRDPQLVSTVSAAAALPWLLVSLPAGVIVDRHDRVRLMWQSQAAQTVIVAIIAMLAAAGRAGIIDLAGLAFVLGIGEVVFGNASQSVLPELVPTELLARANGRQYVVQTVTATFVGPPLGSLLFGIAVGLPFGVDAASFAISAALLATLPRRPRAVAVRRPMHRSIAEGLRYLTRDRLLRTLAILLGINNFCGQFGSSTLVLFATGPLHLGLRAYGLLLASTAVGAVLGGLVNARVLALVGERGATCGALVSMAAAYVGIGLAPNPIVLAIFMAANGFLVTLWNIVTVSLRQELVPPGLLGRVNSVYRMIGWGLMPIGALAGGFVAGAVGLRAPYLVAAALRGLALTVGIPVLLAQLRPRWDTRH